jgi:carbon storage regulator CsrA
LFDPACPTATRSAPSSTKEGEMLVLTQKEGEVLQVGPDVRIYIKRIKGNWVRLCIDAPRDVHLQRIPAHEVVDPTRSARDGAAVHDREPADGASDRARRIEDLDDGREPAGR